MLKVGLTGGIGAGKSTVAGRLAARGAVVVDADRLAREVVAPGTAGLAEIVEAFGAGVLTPQGALDRPALGRIVFADEQARQTLNAITHPRIGVLTAQAFAAAGPRAVVVHDVPLLVENRMGARYHLVVVVHADRDERVRRLVVERGMTQDDAWARVRAQADDEARRRAADVWLDNTRARDDVLAAVDRLWDERLVPFEENVRHRRCADGTGQIQTVDEAAAERLTERVRLATGLRPDAVDRTDDGLRVHVADAAAADALEEPLADAGLPRRAVHRAGGVTHAGADPGAPLTVDLWW